MTLFVDELERRDRTQIIADILQSANQPIKITRLMYATNAQYAKLKEIVDELCDVGLLEEVPRKTGKRTNPLYRATEDGARWCRQLHALYRRLRGKVRP